MATTIAASSNHADEDYIDMEVSSSSFSSSSSSSTFFSHSSQSSPPQIREFEFQMSSSISQEREANPSPADELFYKGKLLPLHLPPRIQMVEKLCQNTKQAFEETHYITISTTPSTSTSTPLASCNISPSESCRVSSELNPDDYFFEWSTEFQGFITDHPKKSWSKKLKQIKHLSLSQKLRASRTYLKSLFSKSGCSNESCAKAAACNAEAGQALNGDKDKDFLSKYTKVTKKNPIEQIGKGKYPPTLAHVMKSGEKDDLEESLVDNNNNSHRKSFSGAIKRHSSKTKCLSSSSSSSSSSSGASSSSSSFSFNSSGFYELQLFKRSSSASSELEGSIEAAIAHCKNSQQIFTRNGLKETGFCSQSVSMAAPSRDQDSREAKCF